MLIWPKWFTGSFDGIKLVTSIKVHETYELWKIPGKIDSIQGEKGKNKQNMPY